MYRHVIAFITVSQSAFKRYDAAHVLSFARHGVQVFSRKVKKFAINNSDVQDLALEINAQNSSTNSDWRINLGHNF